MSSLRFTYFPQEYQIYRKDISPEIAVKQLPLVEIANRLSKLDKFEIDKKSDNRLLTFQDKSKNISAMITLDGRLLCSSDADTMSLEQLKSLHNAGFDLFTELFGHGIAFSPRKSDYLLIYYIGESVGEVYKAHEEDLKKFAAQLFDCHEFGISPIDYKTLLVVHLMKTHTKEQLKKL